jgi:multidrug efflux pump
VLSQILTLYTTPVVYLYLDRFRHWTNRMRRGSRSPGPSIDAPELRP